MSQPTAQLLVKRDRKTGIIIFLLFLLIMSGLFYTGYKMGTFRAFKEQFFKLSEGTITHSIVLVDVEGDNYKPLVPEGYEDSNSVNKIELDLNMIWEISPRDESMEGTLSISVRFENEEGIDVSAIVYALFPTSTLVTSNKTLTIPVVFKMNLPTEETYPLVAGQTIVAIFTFTLSANA